MVYLFVLLSISVMGLFLTDGQLSSLNCKCMFVFDGLISPRHGSVVVTLVSGRREERHAGQDLSRSGVSGPER